MRIVNGTLFTREGTLVPGNVYCQGDRIVESDPGTSTLDAADCIVSPGFLDIHIHGAYGTDLCDGTEEANKNIARYLASVGVTGYLGTTMAMPEPGLSAMLACAGRCMDAPVPGSAVMRGINLEGPFASPEKKGAMDENNLLQPDYDLFKRLNDACGGRIKLADVAPELPGGMEFIKRAARDCRVSLAHSTADYDTAAAAFAAGACHVTHLFNAMPPMLHRAPGLIGAAMDHAQYVELISDGIHVHPAMVRAAFRLFGGDRLCLISDAMMACGMADGAYTLGGQPVKVAGGKAVLNNGTIAGSATPQTVCFRRAVKDYGAPLIDALKACTRNPARVMGMEGELGVLAPGARADFTLLNKDTLAVAHCVIGGALVF